MTFVSLLVSLISTLLLASSNLKASVSYEVGQKSYQFNNEARKRTISTYVWYPIDPKIKTSPINPKGPFLPVIAALDASIIEVPKKFPLVLLSHGSGGKADKLFWIVQSLVRRGHIVVGINHPGNMTGDNSAMGMVRVWERPQDLSFVLDQVIEHSHFKNLIDKTKIAAVGHSAGGTTVLLLAGGKFSKEKFQSPTPNCLGTKDPFFAKICDELKAINFQSFRKEEIEAIYSDNRIQSIVALDPGFARSFTQVSLSRLNAKALVLVAENINAPQDEIYSKDFLTLMKKGSARIVPGTYHMSFLAACKPGISLKDPELKELCIDNDKKLGIQKDVSETILKHFENSWE